jgi:hypothetical protein
MKTHHVSPLTSEPCAHKFLTPNAMACELIAEWCEQNGWTVPVAPKGEAAQAEAGGGAAAAPLLQKPNVMCSAHPKEQLRFFCIGCDKAVCVICAVDSELCKTHTTKAIDLLIQELKADREEWAQVQEECRLGAEQLCLTIQADSDAQIQCIKHKAAALQPTSAPPPWAPSCTSARRARSLWPALLPPRSSPSKPPLPPCLSRQPVPASVAAFRAAAALATAVGHLDLVPSVVDHEDAAAIATAAGEAAAVAAMGALAGSALLRRVMDGNKMPQFALLIRTRLTGKCYRLLYTWSSDGRTNASFHARCDNQVGGITRGLGVRFVTL